MRRLIQKMHGRFGDLWWYTLLLFAATRAGDAVNLFIGLWLVPKHVPLEELGAVLPLTQAVALVGLPMGIVVTPFARYLNLYAGRKEYGKIKSLLRDVFISMAVLGVLLFLFARFLLPALFLRMRIPPGILGVLLIAGGLLTSVSALFSGALQGLKLFPALILITLLGAPCRLAVMAWGMRLRAISGYFLGQLAGPAVIVLGACWALRKLLGRGVAAAPYWKEDGAAMIRYTTPLVAWGAVTSAAAMVDMLVVRHRLSDFESAGYYLISRFSEISTYLGLGFVVVLFPLVAGGRGKDAKSLKTLLHSLAGTLAGGALVSLFLLFGGRWLLGLTDAWRPYRGLSLEMFWLSLSSLFLIGATCLWTFEIAQARFRFFKTVLPLLIFKTLLLYCVTGITFFRGVLPDAWIAAVQAWNPCRLEVLIGFFLLSNLLLFLLMCREVFPAGRQKGA